MKKFLKRVNRGIVLFLLMIVVFIIYVITDTISFRDNKPVVKSVLDNFMTELAVCNVAPEAARSADASVREGAKDAWTKQVEDLTNKYYCYEGKKGDAAIFYYGEPKSQWQNDAKNAVAFVCGAKPEGFVTGCETKLKDNTLKISKCGVNMASAEVSYRYTVSYAGDPQLMIPGGYINMNALTYRASMTKDGEPVDFDRARIDTAVIDLTTSFILKKVDGEWKILYSDYWGWSMVSVTGGDSEESADQEDPDQKGDVE